MIDALNLDTGLRQSALLLHTLSPSDVTWVLAQLDAADRARLQTLLDELVALGIPKPDQHLQKMLMGTEVDPGFNELHCLSQSDFEQITLGEPLWMKKILITQFNWPWFSEWRQSLDAHKQNQFDALDLVEHKPAVIKLIKQELAKRLQRLPRQQSSSLSHPVIRSGTWFKWPFQARGGD